MVTGIVLVNVERTMLQNVIDGLRKIKGIAEVYAVAGEYDLVLMIRVGDNAQLADIIANQLTRDRGIIHTKTLVSLKAYSDIDLEKVFLN
jgi:DNA-binding Lrp family transcriptional regulator